MTFQRGALDRSCVHAPEISCIAAARSSGDIIHSSVAVAPMHLFKTQMLLPAHPVIYCLFFGCFKRLLRLSLKCSGIITEENIIYSMGV